jgi:hypothetical protein
LLARSKTIDFSRVDQEEDSEPPENHCYVPPQTVILLQPHRRRKSRKLPDYDLPPIVQEIVNRTTAVHPFERQAKQLLSNLRPKNLSDEFYKRKRKACRPGCCSRQIMLMTDMQHLGRCLQCSACFVQETRAHPSDSEILSSCSSESRLRMIDGSASCQYASMRPYSPTNVRFLMS